MRWHPIEGLICAGGPVDGCNFALEGGSFGAPGLVLVGLGGQISCGSLVNSAGFVCLPIHGIAANMAVATEVAESKPPPSSYED